jgi:hypothetical protein
VFEPRFVRDAGSSFIAWGYRFGDVLVGAWWLDPAVGLLIAVAAITQASRPGGPGLLRLLAA